MIDIIKKILKIKTKKDILKEILEEIKTLNKKIDSVMGYGQNSRDTSKVHLRVGDWEKNRY